MCLNKLTDFYKHSFSTFYFSVFPIVLITIERLYICFTTFPNTFVKEHPAAARRIFPYLLNVWKSGKTRSFVFDHTIWRKEGYENLTIQPDNPPPPAHGSVDCFTWDYQVCVIAGDEGYLPERPHAQAYLYNHTADQFYPSGIRYPWADCAMICKD